MEMRRISRIGGLVVLTMVDGALLCRSAYSGKHTYVHAIQCAAMYFMNTVQVDNYSFTDNLHYLLTLANLFGLTTAKLEPSMNI